MTDVIRCDQNGARSEFFFVFCLKNLFDFLTSYHSYSSITMDSTFIIIIFLTWIFISCSFPRCSLYTKLVLLNIIVIFDYHQQQIGYYVTWLVVLVVLWHFFLMTRAWAILNFAKPIGMSYIMKNLYIIVCRWLRILVIILPFCWYFGYFWLVVAIFKIILCLLALKFVMKHLHVLQFTNKHYINGKLFLPSESDYYNYHVYDAETVFTIRDIWCWTNFNKREKTRRHNQRLAQQYFDEIVANDDRSYYRHVPSVISHEIFACFPWNDYCCVCNKKMHVYNNRPRLENYSIHPNGEVSHTGCLNGEIRCSSIMRDDIRDIAAFNANDLFFTHKIHSFIAKVFGEINRDLFQSRRR